MLKAFALKLPESTEIIFSLHTKPLIGELLHLKIRLLLIIAS